MPIQAVPFASHPAPPDYPADLAALVRLLARKLAGLDGGHPDVPPIAGGDVPAWHYHIAAAGEILEDLITLLAEGRLLADVVSRRRQRAAARVLRELLDPAP